jgi:hypothetical protein
MMSNEKGEKRNFESDKFLIVKDGFEVGAF